MTTVKNSIRVLILFISTLSFAQVGINTDSPRAGAALDVNGTIRSSSVLSDNIPAVLEEEKENYTYLVLNQNTKAIENLDLSTSGTSGGISSILTYKLVNVNGDWVLNFDTKINSKDYALVILSAWFDQPLKGDNPAPPVARTKEENGTWRLEADYSSVASDKNGTWNISCVVYPKTYSKIFPLQEVDMNDSSSKSAEKPIISY